MTFDVTFLLTLPILFSRVYGITLHLLKDPAAILKLNF